MYLPKLGGLSEVIFLARPRRFGKSLTVSTLDSFYSGEIGLFKGLAADGFMKSPDFVPKPVIHLDMSLPSGKESKASLRDSIEEILIDNATRHNVKLRGKNLADKFSNIIKDVKIAYSQNVVLLVDEYDAPVIKVIQTPGLKKIYLCNWDPTAVHPGKEPTLTERFYGISDLWFHHEYC